MADPVMQEAVRQLQSKAEAHDAELANGRVVFEGMSKDIEQIGKDVQDIKGIVADVPAIRDQTTKTNGRLLKAEEAIRAAELEQAKRDAVAEHRYPVMKLVRDLALGLGLLVTLLKVFG